MVQALVWLLSAFGTAAFLALDMSGLFPNQRWSGLAAIAFLIFLFSTYIKITTLEKTVNLQPGLRVDARDSPDTLRIIRVAEPVGEAGHMQITHDGLFKMIRVEASAFVTSCVVRVVGLRQGGTDVPGFVPCGLRWYGFDGDGAEKRDFVGTHHVLLLYRRPTSPEWELQAPVREGIGARFRYDPGDYEIQMLVSAPNVSRPLPIRGLLHVGAVFDDVTFSPQ